MKLATAAQMRELDRKAIEERGIPSIDLMERAARGVAKAALELAGGRFRRKAAIFCGSGNNGGDGIAAARMLFQRGVKVRVFLVGNYEKMTADALEMTRRLSECGVELEIFDPENAQQQAWTAACDVIVDAMLGVGLSREITAESPVGQAVEIINRSAAPVVSADIASGVDADSGRVLGMAVGADVTVTFSLAKIGQFIGEGKLCSGEVRVIPIGIPEELVRQMKSAAQTLDADFVRWALPKRRIDGHKGSFGKLLAVGGSVGFTGAPWLMAEGAVRSGCGLVYLGVPESIWAVEAVKCVSAMPFPLPEMMGNGENKGLCSKNALQIIREKIHACDVLAIGPGLGRGAETEQVVRAILQETEKPVVLDADGINALEGHMDVLSARRGRTTVLTPHDGEFARMLGCSVRDIIAGDRVEMAADFAKTYGCVLVLKGHCTAVAAPSGNVMVNTTGNSGLAKGGSGDILTGIIASLLCQGATAAQAASAAVWIHGRAADLAAEKLTEYAVTPSAVLDALGEVFLELTAE